MPSRLLAWRTLHGSDDDERGRCRSPQTLVAFASPTTPGTARKGPSAEQLGKRFVCLAQRGSRRPAREARTVVFWQPIPLARPVLANRADERPVIGESVDGCVVAARGADIARRAHAPRDLLPLILASVLLCRRVALATLSRERGRERSQLSGECEGMQTSNLMTLAHLPPSSCRLHSRAHPQSRGGPSKTDFRVGRSVGLATVSSFLSL